MKYYILTFFLLILGLSNQQMLGATMNTAIKDASTTFQGVYAAALTPMHQDFSCNSTELASHCINLMNRGCNGVILFGTTGEGSSFSVEEREIAISKIIELGVDPQRLVIAISSCAIDDAVRLISVAMNQHCSAILLLPPFFYKNVDEAGVIAFYREVIQKTANPDLKIFLYHIPQYSGVPITLNMIRTLREEFPTTVIGIKESEGNLSLTKDILAAFPDFKVFVGNEMQIAEAVQLGASGGMSGIANAYPELITSLYAFGKDPQQPDNNEVVRKIIQTVKNFSLFPAIKAIVKNRKGSAWQIVRPPLIPLNDKQTHNLIEALTEQ